MSTLKQYFFIFGSNPSLSAAELFQVLSNSGKEVFLGEDFLIWESDEIDLNKLISSIGGTVKIGIVEKTISKNFRANDLIDLFCDIEEEKKLYLGFSYYPSAFANTKKKKLFKVGLELKKELRQKCKSVRLVDSKEDNLSSVVVTKNKLLTDQGKELVLMETDSNIVVGETIVVQPFEELGKRDFGRPARDDRSGMIPPKLAQIMINIADVDKGVPILDPFCGSGTILQEAALMGFTKIVGSDKSEKAFSDSKENISWLKQNFPTIKSEIKVDNLSAEKLTSRYSKNYFGAVVTEPYLGSPNLKRNQAGKQKHELEILYLKAYDEISKTLQSGAKLVVIWPIFFNNTYLELENKLKRISLRKEQVLNSVWEKKYPLNFRKNLEYGRPQQKVKREITVWSKG